MTWAEVSKSYCGEFRYEGVLNRLQFYLENDDDCVVYVKPRDAIMLKIRMEFTLEEFFADGGVVSFTDRMAGVLGIHASDMLIVSVYEGSTIIEWQVMQRDEEATDPEDMLDLERVERAYRVLIGTEETFMGSKILNAEVNSGPIFTPFMKARVSDPFFNGNTDRDIFMGDVIEQEEKNEETETTGDNSQQQTTEEKQDEKLIVSNTEYVTTKRVVIEREESILNNNKGYLIISIIITVTLAAIVLILCLAKKCSNK